MEITLQNLSFRYSPAAHNALQALSLDIPSGSCCAILGPTGAGKTTLLYAIAGVLGSHYPDSAASGSIRIGSDVFKPLPSTILFPRVGLAMQDPSVQISGLRETVSAEIRFALENIGMEQHEQEERTHTVLRLFNLLHLSDRRPMSLSGGEMQRVALAALTAAQPRVFLMDEPSTALDTTASMALGRTINSLKRDATVLFTDTICDMALLVADSIAVLEEGKLRFFGDKQRFLEHIADFRDLLPVESWSAVAHQLLARGNSRGVQKLTKTFGIT